MATTVDAIINSCNDTTELAYTKRVITDLYGADVRFFVYEKCGNRSRTRIRLPNRGREFHTFLHHVSRHYNDLSDLLIFTPADIRTRRPHRERVLRRRTSEPFRCLSTATSQGHGTHKRLRTWPPQVLR